MDTFATVSIGRNVGNDGDERLDSLDWDAFRIEVAGLFEVDGEEFHVVGQSVSAEHGIEETYQHGGTLVASPDTIRLALSVLAREYGQTAIAFVIGGERILPS